MSQPTNDEREQIREQRRQELLESATSEPAPAEPIYVDGQDHLTEIVDRYDVVLVDCYADWCGPCQMLDPTIEALAAETDAAVAKVDVDAYPHIAQKLGARGVPTLVLYADGRPAERLVGVQDRATLEELIESHH